MLVLQRAALSAPFFYLAAFCKTVIAKKNLIYVTKLKQLRCLVKSYEDFTA